MGAYPQIKDASKQTDVTSKGHTLALVLKLKKRADMTPNGHVRRLVLKFVKQANKQT